MEFYNIGAWDIRVTLDLYLGGIGVGAYLLSVFLSFYHLEQHAKSIKLGAYAAPILVSLGLLLLVSKIGVPLKFMTTLWNVNFESVMSIGVFLQVGFVFSSIYYAFLIYTKVPMNNYFRIWQTIGVFFALSVGLYHGLFLSSLGRVLWTELTPGMFFASSVVSGIAFVILLKRITEPKSAAILRSETPNSLLLLGLNRVPVMFVILLLVQFTSVLLWQFYTGRLELEQSLSYEYFMQEYGILWLSTVLIGGTIVPMVISIVSLVKNEERMSSNTAIITCLFILVGGFVMKHLMIIGGQIAIPVGFQF